MRVADLVTASVLILLGGLVIMDAVRLGIGWGPDGPNSGFFPFWLAFILVATCAVIIVQEARKGLRTRFVAPEKFILVLKVLAPATLAVALIHWLGLYVSSALYLGFYMRWVGHHSWPVVLLLGLGVPIAIFIIFEQWFLVLMPKGPLEAWLGY
jgi:putative tricarboxylic transport membrane protein